MAATVIDGKASAARLRAKIADDVKSSSTKPGLAVVLVGADPASEVYVRNKEKAVLEVGMNSFAHHLPATTSEAELLTLIDSLNADARVHGILVQLPLPNGIDAQKVLERIDPRKDVDGFHPVNAGKLAVGQDGLVPCTPIGCMILLRETLGDLKGLNAVVVGRSNIVGKPIAQLLLQADCTVTITHSKTKDLAGVCAQADIVIAAIGKPEFIKGAWIKKGATVIDVGINRITCDGKTKLVGDVAYDEALQNAGAITPVPGGVGPMTIACLLANTLKAAKK
ncbi:MAG: bifunctional methylenetetrahydrofolate dehydrogenase/methenyltetrahydrofolate cyclohydrolase FolD [Alphaproteobacteria bacterium]|nr:bifunctional methylenetetrahydrofolate dehydrogenase/methenyltetrahydrofolate cyclohydrolase FolD [Alphaproteobacteria bacterium]